jgi:hypothetical protein
VESVAARLGQTGGGGGYKVAKGTRFYDKPRGNVVGVASTELFAGEGESVEGGQGYQALQLNTPWGYLTVWRDR